MVATEAPSVIINEGAPDFLTVATHYGCQEYALVLGILMAHGPTS